MTQAKVSRWKGLKRNLAAGVLVLGPAVVTAFLLYKSFLFLDGLLSNLVTGLIRFVVPLESPLPGVGLIALIILLLVTGFAVRNVFGRMLFARVQAFIERIPLVNRIYKAVRQISEAILSGRQEVFQSVVLIQYPREGIFAIGIVTAETGGRISPALPEDVVSIFLPTTPNPTSGFLLFVRREEVTYLDISVEEALKLIISGGTISAIEQSAERHSA